MIRQILQMVRKELLTEWRQRSRVLGIFFFAMAVLLMVGFATPSDRALQEIAGGTLWLALLLASTRSLDQSYAVENEHGAMDGLLLWPVDPVAIYYGKAIANTVILFVVAVATLPMLLAVFDAEVKGNLLLLVPIVMLGCAALAAPGTFYGLITSQARGSSVMLPLMLFPLVVPAILASANATTKVFEGDPMGQAPGWMGILVVFNAVHWSLAGAMYGWFLED
ncbi:MAG: heme exporter protein CcmB [Myxococcota bacterium]